jgi:hypothetical protein
VNDPEDRCHGPSLTLSMLISESVYRLIVVVERMIRWCLRTVRIYLFLFRCLVG